MTSPLASRSKRENKQNVSLGKWLKPSLGPEPTVQLFAFLAHQQLDRPVAAKQLELDGEAPEDSRGDGCERNHEGVSFRLYLVPVEGPNEPTHELVVDSHRILHARVGLPERGRVSNVGEDEGDRALRGNCRFVEHAHARNAALLGSASHKRLVVVVGSVGVSGEPLADV